MVRRRWDSIRYVYDLKTASGTGQFTSESGEIFIVRRAALCGKYLYEGVTNLSTQNMVDSCYAHVCMFPDYPRKVELQVSLKECHENV